MKLSNGNLYFRDQSNNNILIVYREGNGVQLAEGDITIPGTSKLRLDGATGGDTYITEVTANTIGFNTAGSERVRINSSGNVGIGTTSPQKNLDITKAGNATLQLKGTGTNNFAGGQLSLFAGTTSDVFNSVMFAMDRRTDGVGGIYLQRRDSSHAFKGSLFQYLDVQGWSFHTASSTTATSTDERLRITPAGSVLIGTTNTGWDGDADNLVVGSGSGNNGMTIYAGSSNFSQINFADSNSGAGRYTGVLRYTHSNNSMSFHTNDGAERMRINSSGNVGIGTSSPKTKLDVENTTAPTLDNDTHAGEAIFLRSGGSAGDGNVQAVLAFGKADSSSRRSGSAIASVQTDSDADKVGVGFYTSDSSSSSQTMDLRMLLNHTGNLHVDADVVAFSTSVSDERLKDNVKTIDNALDKVMKLRGVEFAWNKGNRVGQKDLGLIAQEVEKVLPEIVREKKMAFIDNEIYKTIDYDKVVGVLIEAIKEQQEQINKLEEKLNG